MGKLEDEKSVDSAERKPEMREHIVSEVPGFLDSNQKRQTMLVFWQGAREIGVTITHEMEFGGENLLGGELDFVSYLGLGSEEGENSGLQHFKLAV